MQGRIASINSSLEKGVRKDSVSGAILVAGHGIKGDAHAGGERQISLLAQESINKARRGTDFPDDLGTDFPDDLREPRPPLELRPGDFGENITIEGLDILSLRIGDRLLLASDVIIAISHLGKTCLTPCSIGQRLGECIMPREGIFANVVRGGHITIGDTVEPTTMKSAAVLTSSDRCARGEAEDRSGPVLVALVNELGFALADYAVLPDEEVELSAKMKYLADRCAVDLILTTGGTGLALRDRTPEATLAVLDSQAFGIAEAIRYEGLRHTPNACLSRAVSGLRGRTLIINLPGSTRAIEQSLALLRSILPHALDILRSEVADCGRLRHQDTEAT
ncbi:MAG: molybdopterin-binding protein, partial [Armatimonadetes bacterium]|nr:molybdopterin-binding protein [Armatimonadota bacterium]